MERASFQNIWKKKIWLFMQWKDYKRKSENKNTTNEYRQFFESNFFGVNRLLALVYSNQDNDPKRLET